MSVTLAELQEPVDLILALLGIRMTAGQIVVHLSDDGHVQKIETNQVHKPARVFPQTRKDLTR